MHKNSGISISITLTRHTCFTIGSSVAIITSTSVAVNIISTSTIYTWAGTTFIDVCGEKYIKLF